MMHLLAHMGTGGGDGGNPILTPWEIHPILIHFPIAFVLGGVLLSAYAWRRGRLDLERTALVLLVTGIGTGLLAGAAGFLAFFTVPESHTELAHRLMYWHLGFMLGSLLIFITLAWVRWRHRAELPGVGSQLLMWLTTAIFIVGAALGGHIVYHGGAGIEPDLMRPGLHEEHHPAHGAEQHPGEHHSGQEPSHESH
jgi:uncharacterized membrane protein